MVERSVIILMLLINCLFDLVMHKNMQCLIQGYLCLHDGQTTDKPQYSKKLESPQTGIHMVCGKLIHIGIQSAEQSTVADLNNAYSASSMSISDLTSANTKSSTYSILTSAVKHSQAETVQAVQILLQQVLITMWGMP